jgi:hypothetical protein
VGNVLWATITFTCVAGLPAAIAVAALRHGLYEVDLVINRTAVWPCSAVSSSPPSRAS